MPKQIILLFAVLLVTFSKLMAQTGIKTYTTEFTPHSVTYNASDNPNECLESVAWGILIKDKKNTFFFSLPFSDLENLKTMIGNNEVIVEVIFYEERAHDSDEDGNVTKITLNGTIIFDGN